MPRQHRTIGTVYCGPAPILTTVTMAVAGVEESMPDHAAPDPRLASVQLSLDLLAHQPVLLAVTLPHTVAA